MKKGVKGVVGLVLAAGLAQRMGACKALLSLARKSAIEQIVTRMRKAGIESILVVTGGHEEEIQAEALRLGCSPVYNPAFRSGMFSSVLAGVRALPVETEAFFLLPADTPLIKPITYKLLTIEFHESFGRPEIVYPTFGGERGHPPLIGRAMIEKIRNWSGDGGLRGLLDTYPSVSLDVPTADRSVLMDMDTPADYETLNEYAAREYLPDRAECLELLAIAKTPERVIRHTEAVAEAAVALADALAEKGMKLDRRLLYAAGMLHDIAKGRKNHEIEGARWLRKRGYTRVARLTGLHKDLPERGKIGEEEILYLCDRLTDNCTVGTLAARMLQVEARFAPGSDALAAGRRRIVQAMEIQREVESTLKRPLLEAIVFYGEHIAG